MRLRSRIVLKIGAGFAASFFLLLILAAVSLVQMERMRTRTVAIAQSVPLLTAAGLSDVIDRFAYVAGNVGKSAREVQGQVDALKTIVDRFHGNSTNQLEGQRKTALPK